MLPPPDRAVADPAYRRALEQVFSFSAGRKPETGPDRRRKIPRMQALLAALGNPHHAYPALLVAGTKGKGSTAAFAAAILRAAGYRVGRYCQPHLLSYRERIWIDGTLLAMEDLVRLVDEVAPAARALERRHPDLGTPTTFEVGTALALLAFARQQVQVAVVEVGIGGAHDATRVVDAPVAAVAPISYDHVAVLGPTIGDIAREKAGVFAEGGSAAIGRQLPEAAAVLTRVAEARRCHLSWLDQEFGWEAVGSPLPTAPCRLWGPWGRIEGVQPSLVGRHQRDNAAVAAMATHLLGQHGFPVDRDAIAAGLSTAVWPGRFQVVPGSPLLVLDGAHNGASAEALAATLRECFPRRPVVVVLAVGEDKDVDGITAALSTIAHRAVVTRTTHERAMDAERVGQLLAARGVAVEVRARSDDALQRAMAAAGPDGVVCVTGSLFLVGEALASLESSGRALPHGTAASIQPPPPAMTPHH